MIQKHFKKFFIKISVILVFLYLMLLLYSDNTSERTENDAIAEVLSTIPPTERIQNILMEELLARRKRIQNVCGNKQAGRSRTTFRQNAVIFRKLYVDLKHNISWCPIYKAASSTIMRIFAASGGKLTPDIELEVQKGQLQLNKLAREAFPVMNPNNYKAVFSSNRLIVVRHPFERLLSAYRDKLEHRENREFYYKKYGEIIVRRFGTSKQEVEPTFVEFLQYVASSHASVDEHWRPYYKECAPCDLDYNLILKTESLHKELQQLFTELGLREYLPDEPVNINPEGHTNIQIIQQYFSQVPLKLLHSIYQVYQKDFELYDYSPDMYLNMTILQ